MDLNNRRLAVGSLALVLPAGAALAMRQSRTRRSAEGQSVRDAMSAEIECVADEAPATGVAEKLAEWGVGAVPVCGEAGELMGMVTDRDIVVKVLAQGADPAKTTAGELCGGKPVSVGTDDSLEEAARKMVEHKLRRLPVTDGREVIGLVSQADLAEHLSAEATGRLVESISAAPPDGRAAAWLFARAHT